MPGPRRKQAEALKQNIRFLASTFTMDHMGFVTITVGDREVGGRFRNLRDRKEAQRRFHSLMTNELARRYLCGVVVPERHANQGIHFHIVVVTRANVRGGIDMAKCFPPKGPDGKPLTKPDYSSANGTLRMEWAFWRRVCKRYGFGRHEFRPAYGEPEALGGYMAKYLKKDWANRLPEDRGARCLRYFGHWDAAPRAEGTRRKAPPWGSRFGWLGEGGRGWREKMRQLAMVSKLQGAPLTPDSIAHELGPRWCFKLMQIFPWVRFMELSTRHPEALAAIQAHNKSIDTFLAQRGLDPGAGLSLQVAELSVAAIEALWSGAKR